MPASLTIQVFTDLCCPWCVIGVIRLDKVLTTMTDEVRAAVVHHPRILDPSTPEAGTSIRDLLMQRYGVEPSVAFAPAEAEARASGISLALSKQPYSYPTISGHTLIRHASSKGTQHAIARALLEAYFLDARNIADIQVLDEIARRYGFVDDEARMVLADPEQRRLTLEDSNRSAALGVNSVPTFVFGDAGLATGGLSEAGFKAAIRQALEPSRLATSVAAQH
jgi:predicted DsbA family dithiol-disulfide isomerase